jgi:hypothetical protein
MLHLLAAVYNRPVADKADGTIAQVGDEERAGGGRENGEEGGCTAAREAEGME